MSIATSEGQFRSNDWEGKGLAPVFQFCTPSLIWVPLQLLGFYKSASSCREMRCSSFSLINFLDWIQF